MIRYVTKHEAVISIVLTLDQSSPSGRLWSLVRNLAWRSRHVDGHGIASHLAIVMLVPAPICTGLVAIDTVALRYLLLVARVTHRASAGRNFMASVASFLIWFVFATATVQ